MGAGKASGKVTTREGAEEPTRDTKPKFNGVLTEQMVDTILTQNVNNVAENKSASVNEVAKKVVEALNRRYGGNQFRAVGRFVELDDKKIEIKKKKNGLFDAED